MAIHKHVVFLHHLCLFIILTLIIYHKLLKSGTCLCKKNPLRNVAFVCMGVWSWLFLKLLKQLGKGLALYLNVNRHRDTALTK